MKKAFCGQQMVDDLSVPWYTKTASELCGMYDIIHEMRIRYLVIS
jgi:hypothetical protein